MIDEISGAISASMMGGMQPPQQMSDFQRNTVQKTLASFDANNLSAENIKSIHKYSYPKALDLVLSLKLRLKPLVLILKL